MSHPPAEALTLSATLFHADVDAWLPAGFGVVKSEKDKNGDWEKALRGGGRDRLGLGHPDLDDPLSRAKSNTARAGIDALRKIKGKAKDVTEVEVSRKDDSDDEESRTRSVSKVKKRSVDVFGKKNAVHPLLNLKAPIPGYDSAPAPSAATGSTGSEVPTGTKRARDTDDEQDDTEDKDAVSKSQARREKRRRAKLRKAEAKAAAA